MARKTSPLDYAAVACGVLAIVAAVSGEKCAWLAVTGMLLSLIALMAGGEGE